jgi:hypothetical protein
VTPWYRLADSSLQGSCLIAKLYPKALSQSLQRRPSVLERRWCGMWSSHPVEEQGEKAKGPQNASSLPSFPPGAAVCLSADCHAFLHLRHHRDAGESSTPKVPREAATEVHLASAWSHYREHGRSWSSPSNSLGVWQHWHRRGG